MRRILRGISNRLLLLAVTLSLLTLAPGLAVAEAPFVRLLAGAGLRQPVELLADEFSKQTGIKVYIDWGGSGKLMTRYLASGRGGLFMPGAFHYIIRLKKRGKVVSSRLTALHTPVVAVYRPKADLVKSLADLARPGLKVGLGDAKAMAMGRLADKILDRAGLATKVAPNVKVRTATVKQLAFYVARGYVAAAIIARADAWQYRKNVVMIPIPKRYFTPDVIAVALLHSAVHPKAAAKLQAYLSSPRARKVFTDFGFLPIPKKGK